jgi:hypothetical protein
VRYRIEMSVTINHENELFRIDKIEVQFTYVCTEAAVCAIECERVQVCSPMHVSIRYL